MNEPEDEKHLLLHYNKCDTERNVYLLKHTLHNDTDGKKIKVLRNNKPYLISMMISNFYAKRNRRPF